MADSLSRVQREAFCERGKNTVDRRHMMIRTIPILMFAAVILNASSGCLRSAPQLIPSSTQGTDAPSQASPDVARMEQVVQSYVSNKPFMGSVLVAHGDDILFNKGYGYSGSRWLAIPFLATL